MNDIFIAYYIKINYNVGLASPEFDNILTNKPECVILRPKKLIVVYAVLTKRILYDQIGCSRICIWVHPIKVFIKMSTFITERNDIAWRKKTCHLRSIKINVIVKKFRQLDIILPFFFYRPFFLIVGRGVHACYKIVFWLFRSLWCFLWIIMVIMVLKFCVRLFFFQERHLFLTVKRTTD